MTRCWGFRRAWVLASARRGVCRGAAHRAQRMRDAPSGLCIHGMPVPRLTPGVIEMASLRDAGGFFRRASEAGCTEGRSCDSGFRRVPTKMSRRDIPKNNPRLQPGDRQPANLNPVGVSPRSSRIPPGVTESIARRIPKRTFTAPSAGANNHSPSFSNFAARSAAKNFPFAKEGWRRAGERPQKI
jgi:hypothetical protein